MLRNLAPAHSLWVAKQNTDWILVTLFQALLLLKVESHKYTYSIRVKCVSPNNKTVALLKLYMESSKVTTEHMREYINKDSYWKATTKRTAFSGNLFRLFTWGGLTQWIQTFQIWSKAQLWILPHSLSYPLDAGDKRLKVTAIGNVRI